MNYLLFWFDVQFIYIWNIANTIQIPNFCYSVVELELEHSLDSIDQINEWLVTASHIIDKYHPLPHCCPVCQCSLGAFAWLAVAVASALLKIQKNVKLTKFSTSSSRSGNRLNLGLFYLQPVTVASVWCKAFEIWSNNELIISTPDESERKVQRYDAL